MKKYLIIAAWSIFSISLLWAMYEVKVSQEHHIMHTPLILIDTPQEMVFLKQEDILYRLNTKGIKTEHVKKKEINTAYIEKIIEKMPEVETVKVYTELNGNWTIQLKIRRPIARIINNVGESFYLDDKGKTMPLSSIYTARVIPVNGFIGTKITHKPAKKIINNDSLKSISKLDQVYAITDYVCNDPFLFAQISQIFVEQNGDFVLIPRVGGQKIIFGKVENDTIVKNRFDKLKIFYQKAMPIAGWNTYSKINLKFKQQIVCTKK